MRKLSICLGCAAALITIIGGIFYLGVWTQSYDSKLHEIDTKLSFASQKLSKTTDELMKVKELALTAKIKLDGVKSQTAVLGKELKVDVETPFQQVIASAQKESASPKEQLKTNTDVGRPPLQVRLNDFLFESKGCHRQGADMVCKVVATNLMDEDRKIGVNKATLYDDHDDARLSRIAYFHGQQYNVSVPALSRSNLVYTFKSVPKKSIPVSLGFVLNENGEFNDVLRSWLTN